MKFHITVEVEPRTPDGWDSPADAEETSHRLIEDLHGMDYEGAGVAFTVTNVEVSVVEP
jgi:hypothetical protein